MFGSTSLLNLITWTSENVDLIGPYVVRTPTATHTLRALTMIDPVTGWFAVIAIPDKDAPTVMESAIIRG